MNIALETEETKSALDETIAAEAPVADPAIVMTEDAPEEEVEEDDEDEDDEDDEDEDEDEDDETPAE